MHQALPNPCDDCPFRKNSLRGWLGPWHPQELSRHVMSNDYACHQTQNDPSDYEDMDLDEPLPASVIEDLIQYDAHQCRGSVLYREKNGYQQACSPAHEKILSIEEFMVYHDRNQVLVDIKNSLQMEEEKPVAPRPLIATKFAGRTIAGIQGQDEDKMWKIGDELWGQVVTKKRLKTMWGDSAEDLDRFRSEYLSFASEGADEQYTAFCEDRLLPL
jgi:hypothetical protein